MNAINATLTAWADRLLAPLQEWPPVCTLLVLSVVAGMLMAVVFRYTSNQRALRRVADRSRAQVLAIKLFKDDLGTMFGSLNGLLRYTLLRLLYSLPPMLVMLVPFVLVLAQLALRYEYRPLAVGEHAVLELQMAPHAWEEHQTVPIEAPPQIDVETEPLRDVEEKAVYWRIRAKQAVPGTVRWKLGSHSDKEVVVEKQVAITDDATRLPSVSARRPGPSWWDRLLYPGEPGFSADSPVQAVVVHYARRSTPVFGFDVVWWLTFLIASMLAAVLVRPLVKVQF